ncbi:hypothetical protein O3G_MSEX002285 [Manduca sexta]|uniref:UPAR/Ly6 domain-containing protein n=1 Tax=Manduca sexta TaxID=7130 RepID=A0A922CDN6_MANSE|nr:hypothetical protein O3G_MSEX002285 [Manduca sexta]
MLYVDTCHPTLGPRLRCYACSFSSVDSDQSCMTITNSTNTVSCPHEFCTIMRQEFIDPAGVVASFTRGCEQKPDFLNHEIVDPTFRTFYRACTSDLCNIGNGIQAITGGNLSPSPQYLGPNLLVPGTGTPGNGAIAITSSSMMICFITLVMFIN